MDKIQNGKNIISRLSKVEGQVKGIISMVETERECEEVVTQISAVTSAMRNIARLILEEHIAHCVNEAMAENDTEKLVVSLTDILNQYAKMK